MNVKQPRHLLLEDDAKEPIKLLVRHRIPWLFVGLLGGIALPFISSKFEGLLSGNISLVFFVPIVVYLSDAVGTQSQTIYIRNAAQNKVKFSTYLLKELVVGSLLGLVFGLGLGLYAYFWLKSSQLATVLILATFINISLAPIVAITVSKILQHEKADPALGSGPFATVLQDLISLTIYLVTAWFVILN